MGWTWPSTLLGSGEDYILSGGSSGGSTGNTGTSGTGSGSEVAIKWRSVKFASGWYCDALPTGEFAVLFPTLKYLKTHLGVLEFNANTPLNRTTNYAPLFLRITNVGEFKIAGQAWDAPDTVEYAGGGWSLLPTAVGVLPVIYDNSGILYISDGSYPGPGSQGYVYVDFYTGAIVNGMDTYQPSATVPLYQYTDLGDGMYIGQGSVSGCIYWNSNTKIARLVEPGDTRFIRSHRSVDDRISIAMWNILGSQMGESESVLKFGTIAGLNELPIVTLT